MPEPCLPLDVRTLPDDDLRRRYLADDPNDNGETFIAIYVRYRDRMRSAMQQYGLAAVVAERRVGAVFIAGMECMRAAGEAERPLVEYLLDAARAAADSEWEEV
jgi:hypothetical protein